MRCPQKETPAQGRGKGGIEQLRGVTPSHASVNEKQARRPRTDKTDERLRLNAYLGQKQFLLFLLSLLSVRVSPYNKVCTFAENMLELRQLGVETEFDKRVVSEIPTPNGVALQPTKLRCSSTGVSLTAFFSSVLPHPAVLRTIASVHPDGAEEKGYAVCRKTTGQLPPETRTAGRIIKPRGLRYPIRSMMMLTER